MQSGGCVPLGGEFSSVCETKVVQDLAKKGHAFEQNQLGIASMLAIVRTIPTRKLGSGLRGPPRKDTPLLR